MKQTLLAVLVCGLVSSSALAKDKPCRPDKHARLPAITELTYPKARKRLLSAGWQPIQTKSFNEADTDPDISGGNGLLFWRRGYVEVESCSGTGVAACAFLFKDAYGNHLRVTTAGEELPKEKAYARVTGFRFVCESKKDSSLLRPSDAAYAEAMEFARFLKGQRLRVESVHRSKLESFFRGINKAAFFKTRSGVIEIIFFPDANGAEQVQTTERRDNGRYIYTFQGQPHPNPPGDTIDSVRPIYFVRHGSWFIVTSEQEIAKALKSGLAHP
ncbi:MAG TPA: hypothetical protein VGJ48_14090 [Pyrinomonadaceae bacterium]|jgi:hypothetical protein